MKGKVDSKIQQCVELIANSKNIVVLTGAGISTSAGIPDFRGPKGLYVTKRYDPDKVFDINYFHHDQKPFFEFARDFVKLEDQIKPTRAHCFLGELEKHGKEIGIVTQNIDSLHQMAGSKNVVEIHGSFWESHCQDCGDLFHYEVMKQKIYKEIVPHCGCGGVIKPDIVFFGENVKHLNEAFRLAKQADLLFVIGTSCVVYPAAMVPTMTHGKVVIVNRDEVHLDAVDVVLQVQEDIDGFFETVGRVLNHG